MHFIDIVSEKCSSQRLVYFCFHFFGHSQKDKASNGKQISGDQGLWVGKGCHCKVVVQVISWGNGTILCSDCYGDT